MIRRIHFLASIILVSIGGEELNRFEVAGFDGKFRWYSSKKAHYAWADNPRWADLYNKESLPASLFRAGD